MIISRTPYRISFFGGGHGLSGVVSPARRRGAGGDHQQILLPDLPLPAAVFRAPHPRGVFQNGDVPDARGNRASRRCAKHCAYLKMDRGIEIHHDGDLPGRSGMGSSSAFTVGLLHALHALAGPGRRQKATGRGKHPSRTGRVEGNGRFAGPGLRGLRRREPNQFSPKRRFFRAADDAFTPDRLEELNSHLMLFYTGIKRTASEVPSQLCGWAWRNAPSC